MLAGESHEPGVCSVVIRVISPLLAPLRAALRSLDLPPRALGSTLGALLLILSLHLRLPLPLLRSTLLSLLALAVTRRNEEKSGDEALYPRRSTLGALTLSDILRQVADSEASAAATNFDIVSSSLRRTAT